MKKIGVTGNNGFIGKHLFNTLSLYKDEFSLIPFERKYFEDEESLDQFVKQCDVIVHLAALNRHESQEFLYKKNIELTLRLIHSLERTNAKPHIVVSSSLQEYQDNFYGKSKKESRKLLLDWSEKCGAPFTGAIIPNVFGAFCKPNYNSFIATFCDKLVKNEEPEIHMDAEVNLIYVQDLVSILIEEIRKGETKPCFEIRNTTSMKVSEILTKLKSYKKIYLENSQIPELTSSFEVNLFNTFRSYIDLKSFFPKKYVQHTDNRGSFVELIRLGIGGQVSFSTTLPGITRGNHFHTRKIERFAVIKGYALIEMRRIDSEEVISFKLNGEEPAFVDMPIWYTHNIKNIGEGILYTNFWINEPYDPKDPDTYFVEV
ncbi:MAG: SDR family oxidoreductase [Cytophagia bacterium]|nr:SDR family oxidoreductase [Cytophagia bacterium]